MLLDSFNKIYMVGIKGGGMTALAVLLKDMGKNVKGWDVDDNFFTDKILTKHNLSVEHSPPDRIAEFDVIVYSTAYHPNSNPILKQALKNKIPIYTYPQVLGQIMKAKNTISIIGTHGKTTTTALLAYILDKAGLSPTALIGSRVPQLGGNTLVGKSDFFIVETDEYQNKFKYYYPRSLIITNIEWDHPDYYNNFSNYKEVFIDFINKIGNKGFVLANMNDPHVVEVVSKYKGKLITLGNNDTDWKYSVVKQDYNFQYLKVFGDNNLVLNIKTRLFGDFNAANVALASAAAWQLGADKMQIQNNVANFVGTERRLEFKGEYHGALIYDDFAHHPSAIKATLKMVRKMFPHRRIIVLYQPHTYSRTKALFLDFVSSFDLADNYNDLIRAD